VSAAPRALALAALLAGVCGCARQPSSEAVDAPLVRISDGRYAMGTILELELVGRDPAQLRAELDALFAEVEALEAPLSTWRKESDLSRLNRAAGDASVALAPPAFDLLQRSLALARESGGRFDVTVGPLVDLWRNAAERGRWPSSAELAEARSRVGSDQLVLRADGSAALATQGARVEVGGIAKGYALDCLAERLRARGFGAALLDFGGSSVVALGSPPAAAGWRLLARDASGTPLGVLTLRDQSLSVSGSLAQGALVAGRRIGHVIDPRSGLPLERALQAIALAADATRAEACSKAYLVAGEDASDRAQLAGSGFSCEVLVAAEGAIVFESPGFARATRFERLKPTTSDADAQAMASDLPCPICSADIDTSGAQLGEEVFCSFCGAPARVVRRTVGEDQSELGLEEE
jgi:thiamine biosynthesis lipoprotein